MKTCIQCGTPKPVSEFYTHPEMADGHLGKCKKCCKDAANVRRTNKINEVRAYDRERGKLSHRLEANRDRQREHPEAHQKALKRYRRKHPEKYAAQTAVGNAVRDGKLKKTPCEVCGTKKVEGHHNDYSKPLEIRWLCDKHHKEADKLRREKS